MKSSAAVVAAAEIIMSGAEEVARDLDSVKKDCRKRWSDSAKQRCTQWKNLAMRLVLVSRSQMYCC